MRDGWEARLREAVDGVTSDEYFVEVQPADIRAALEQVEELEEDNVTLREGWDREEKLRRDRDAAYQKRVEELEAHWRDFMQWDESAIMFDYKQRAEGGVMSKDTQILRSITEVQTINTKLREENARLRKRVEELERDFTHAASLASKHEQRAEAAEAKLAKVVELHSNDPDIEDGKVCTECHYDWPCLTVAAAKGE